ncbi:YbaK/EbsC family protein [uncultured Nisaea sp.]|jgi:prolyl-tRNA editing enzyme YbaK/EbsC (Cys-tRNA(Pro) deacylase)|uniref:YbaK/EbsC family protein n=1 Tax=uncultured Nisaea sp. TaxID=538215 RepID=UPI0030ED0F92|tara:strand:- start:208 stop:675 length:468 start_codon:yes stop_codon:yes gene_type:complete|eukprot:NODE_4114_length_815_cov_0.713663_g4091_i0.p2 GENE.NODE_4114_length_815_cov_0.713663_g4091_i0~~NODE_4114_length_815_cov_0.713663_g4091_i0.p2  ORF type:complete len:156 (+),score=31.89 NODE_4114_length_815_cov_0.713663_g4091_i0:93-560(+)
MSKSVNRVKAAAEAAGLTVEILRMPDSTRTAAEAAAACGCDVAQIVKSLIFKGGESGALKLLLVSGANQVDLEKAAALVGEPLERADPKEVREITGFAIGGVSPLGHMSPVETWMDETLLGFGTVWAAAGAPNAVFEASPDALKKAAGAAVAALS